MPPVPYQQFIGEVVRLYRQHAYAEALARLDQHRADYPEGENTLYNFHYCVAALLGQKERALQLIAESLEAGQCWPKEVLLDDSDLASLKDEPGFQGLVERSQALYEELAASSFPELMVVPPAGNAPRPYPLLLAVHGRNENAAVTLPQWQALASQGWVVAVAQSSQPAGPGIYRWDDTELSRRELQEHYATLKEEFPLDESRFVLGGFSQGGGLVIRMVLTGALPARGFIAVGPFIHDHEALLEKFKGCDLSHRRGYLVTGAKDDGRENFTRTEALLAHCALPYRREDYPDIAHEYPADFDQTIQRAVSFLLNR